jgi:hypothetical protein
VKRWLLALILLGPITLLVVGTLIEIARRKSEPAPRPALTSAPR